MNALWNDIRYALRTLRKSPGFTALAVIILALGIGANTAIFSVVNSLLLRPLPFPQSSRLVRVWHVPPPEAFPGIPQFAVSAANYVDWQAQNHVFEKMAIYAYRSFDLTGTGHPEPVRAAAVSPDFFSVLGTNPMLGRTFTPEEDQPGHGQIVLLSHAFWQSHCGASPNVVGQSISFNGQAYRIAGVMPPSFRLPEWAQAWTPMAWTLQERAVRGEHHYVVIARLRQGVPLGQAQAEMDAISSRLQKQYPADDKGWGAVVVPLHEDLVSDVRTALWVLLAAVLFVLLIACANVANLVLARTLGRRKEIAIRSALGASRGRVISQTLAETVTQACAGGLLGVFLAQFGVRMIVHALGDKIPRFTDITLDAPVLIFALAVSLLSGIIAGVAPSWHLTGTDVNHELKQGLGRTDSESTGNRTRAVLVVSEVSLSLLLLIGAGLMIRSLSKLQKVEPGFDPGNVLTMTVSVSGNKFPDPPRQTRFFDEILRRVRALPGVTAAGTIDDLPLDNQGSHQPIAIEGRPPVPMSEQPEVDARLVSTGYMRALRIPVLRGRDFNDGDVAGRPSAVLISQSMAKTLWPNEDPVGKRLTMTFFPDSVREIVGVVGDVKQDGLDETRPATTLYMPLDQISVPAMGGWHSFGMSLVVRTGGDPVSLASAVTEAVHTVDAETPVLDTRTMEQFVGDSLSPRRLNMMLLAGFAGVALLLAAVGIYGMLSYSVKRRMHEIGIRMALGAQIGDVLRLVVVEGMRPTLIGLGIGLVGALALARGVSSLLFGISARDPLTFAAVPFLLALVALLACLIPAYRATLVDPMKTLRDE